EGELQNFINERYSSWDSGVGAEIEADKHDLKSLEGYMLEKGDITPNVSGRQEMLEHLINRYVY
ncbi:MAG: xylose isomerase, partial [Pirellulales bacterium]